MATKRDLPSGLVTFIFTDIEGSTRLAQLLGGQYRPMLAQHRQILRRALGASDGVAMFTEGDSVFAVFADAAATSAGFPACTPSRGATHAAVPERAPTMRRGRTRRSRFIGIPLALFQASRDSGRDAPLRGVRSMLHRDRPSVSATGGGGRTLRRSWRQRRRVHGAGSARVDLHEAARRSAAEGAGRGGAGRG